MAHPLTKLLGRNIILKTSKGMRLKPLANKQLMETQPFVIGDLMNKVHMGKKKSLVTSANAKIDLEIKLVYSYGV